MEMGLYIMYLFFWAVACAGKDQPSVNSDIGVFNGKSHKHSFNGRHYVTSEFLGIPYAKPPVGDLRFKRPVPFGKFSESFDATEFGSACPQNNMLGIGVDSYEEDCLTLNIFVPTDSSDDSRGFAVMIFIHGGGFIMGGSNMVPGEVLCSFGKVILVTINYRLGVFGFLNTGDDRAPGNMGLWDQRLAIQWVSDNIAAFGGDNSRITIFGESAGSMSVFMQGMYPENKGLFHNIIGESGTPAMPFGILNNNLDALQYLTELLKCPKENADIFECVQANDAKTIMTTLAEAGKDLQAIMRIQFLPTIDNEIIKKSPMEIVLQSKVDTTDEMETLRSFRLINGINTAEGGMWLPYAIANIENPDEAVISHEDMRNLHIANSLQGMTLGKPLPDLLLSLVASEYKDWSNPVNARNMYVKFMGDIFFNVPGAEMSMLHANSTQSKSWLYSFAAGIQEHFLMTPSWLDGANHGDELLPVFGYAMSDIGPFSQKKDFKVSDWELDLANNMMTLWTNLAKYGNPNGGNNEKQKWPQYDVEDQKYLTINKENSVGQYLYAKEVNFWRELVPQVIAAVSEHSDESPFAAKSSETCEADGNCG